MASVYSSISKLMRTDKAVVEREIIDNLSNAMDLWYSGKTHGYAGLFAEEITYFDPLQNERIETLEQLRSHYATLEGQANFPRWEFIDLKRAWLGDSCVVTYFLKQFTDEGPAGPTWKVTEMYSESDGDWRISHAHWSAIPPQNG